MTNPIHQIADAIREVTVSIQAAIDEGHRSRAIDADDLVEALLSIADLLDPPIPRNRRKPGRLAHDAPRSPRAGVFSLVRQSVTPPEARHVGRRRGRLAGVARSGRLGSETDSETCGL